MELREFIEQRIAEDEAAARDACDGDSGRWFMGDKWNVYRSEDEAPWEDFEENKLVTWGNVKSQSEFIARHDPARILRDVEAKRRLINRILQYEASSDGEYGCCHDAEAIGRGGCPEINPNEIEALRLLALPYSDHPDYDAAWSPGNVTPRV